MSGQADIALEARVLAWRVFFGLIERSEIERWAVDWIEKLDQPPDAIIDLATVDRMLPEDILHALRAFGGSEERAREICVALASADFFHFPEHDLKEIMRKLSDIGTRLDENSDEARLLGGAWAVSEAFYFEEDGKALDTQSAAEARAYLSAIKEQVVRMSETSS